MSKNYHDIAEEILKNIGQEENVEAVTHCMTRLRFNLKNVNRANTEAISKISGVTGVVSQGGQYQVVIGTDVANVYNELQKLGDFSDELKNNSEEKQTVVNKVLGTITAIFQPIIPAIAGSGMLKAVLALLVFFGAVSKESQTYILINTFADAVFYFMPMLLAYSSARHFKTNPYLAVGLAGVLLHPNFMALNTGDAVAFFGIPVKMASYANSVVPIILIVLLQSFVERIARKYVHDAVKVFMVPMLTMLIVAPIAIIVLGPLGTYIGSGLYYVFEFLNDKARWLLPVLIGTFTPFLVMTGMHYSLAPVQLIQYTTLGYGTLLGPGMLVSNISQGAAALLVSLRTKNKDLKQIAASGGVTALFGITEPVLYGVNLKLKTPLYASMIGGFVGGLWAGFVNLRTYSSATAGLLALPVYITEDLSNVVNAVIAIVIAIVVTVIALLILGFKDETVDVVVEAPSKEIVTSLNKTTEIKSPIVGEATSLTEVPDEVFSKGIVGKGIAIKPTNGLVKAPITGTVSVLFPTHHAIGITSDEGVEVLIHVGIDTVQLNGEGFKPLIAQGDKIQVGDILMEVDLELIASKGYNTITPIIISNTETFVDVIETSEKNLNYDTTLLTVYR